MAFEKSAAAPATWGAAIDVPCMTVEPESYRWLADLMPTPGAQVVARAVVGEVGVVVGARGGSHGDRGGHSCRAVVATRGRSLPAATTTVIPSRISPITASSSIGEAEPPRLMFTTAGTPWRWSSMTQLMPSMMTQDGAEPLQSRALTGTMSTDFATPHLVPPIVPATCVPCPAQSWIPVPSPKSK